MEEIKFKYIVNKPSGHTLIETFHLHDIENGYVKSWFKNNLIGKNETIHKCQYIGTEDEDKKEIYADDIIEVTDGDGWIVGKMVVKFEAGFHNQLELDARCVGKIIGNIHQNPELLNL